MALDPNIPLQVRTPQMQSPLESVGRVLTLQDLLQNRQIGQERLKQTQLVNRQEELQIRDAEAEQRDQSILQQAYQDVQGDFEKLPMQAAKLGIRPKHIAALEKEKLGRRKELAEIDDKLLKVRQFQNDQILGLVSEAEALPDDQYAASWKQIRQAALSINPDLQIPEQPIPKQGLGLLRMGLQTETGRLKAEDDRREQVKFDAELPGVRADSATKQVTAQQVRELGMTAAQKAALDQQGAALTQRQTEAEQRTKEAAASRALTARGQNMTDARQREMAEVARETKPATVAENNSLGFYVRAKNSTEVFESLEKQMADKGIMGQIRYRYAPNIAQSEENQVFRQAERVFTEARLRKESGAAIPPHEYENDAKTYFPQAGDSKKVLERKRDARAQVLRSLRISAGKAMKTIGEEPGDMPSVAPKIPKSGAIEDGFVFIGGDPSQKSNWKKGSK